MNTTISNLKIKIIRKNIKNTYLRIKGDTIVVTTNYLTPKIYINKLINNNTKSLIKMLEHQERISQNNEEFKLFGIKYNIIFDENKNSITINSNDIIAKNEQELNKYIETIIKDIYSKRLEFWYKKFEENIPRPNLKIRKMKSRWGVCNTKNHNITLNYYLYRYNIDCLDYVIVHELSHLIEGNHSPSFWKIVEKYYPKYKKIKKQLRS